MAPVSRERERPAGHFSATRSSCFESIDCDIFRRNASERQRVSDRCHSVVFSFFRPKRRNCFVDWCNPTQVKIPFQFLNRSNCVSPSQVDTFVFCFYSSGHAEREIRSFPMSRPPKATTFRNTTLSGLVKCQHCDTFNVEINPNGCTTSGPTWVRHKSIKIRPKLRSIFMAIFRQNQILYMAKHDN